MANVQIIFARSRAPPLGGKTRKSARFCSGFANTWPGFANTWPGFANTWPGFGKKMGVIWVFILKSA
ncbi:MAG: hypothetical protein ACPGWR_03945 [Ardenticatenaceae bacterium]